MWKFSPTKRHALYFSVHLNLMFSSSPALGELPAVGLTLALVQLIQHCPPSARPERRVSCSLRAWPRVPRLSRRAEELLTPMDFPFVDLAESMFCFCLPRQGPWISIFFHHSLSLRVSVCSCLCLRLSYFLWPFPTLSALWKPHPLCQYLIPLLFLCLL